MESYGDLSAYLKPSVGLDLLLPMPRVIRIASDGLPGLPGPFMLGSNGGSWPAVLGDGGWMSTMAGPMFW